MEVPKAELSESELVELARRSVARTRESALSSGSSAQIRRWSSEEADFLEINRSNDLVAPRKRVR
jgi:hypothetical protein